MTQSIILIGAGGHARVVASTCRAAGLTVEAVYDDDSQLWGSEVMGTPIRGPVADLRPVAGQAAIVGVGDARARRSLVERLDLPWATVVHPHTYVDPTVQLGPGSVVFAGAVLQPEVRIGAHVVVNTAASVDHNCSLDDYVQVAPGANLCGNVKIGTGTFVGAGAVILENLAVGPWAIVGGGAVVIRDVPAGVVVVGCPAREIRRSHHV